MDTPVSLDIARHEREQERVVAEAYHKIREAVYAEGLNNSCRSAILSLLLHEINTDMLRDINEADV